MSAWHREPSAPSFGSLDRACWGWKKKDMADATLQVGAILALRAQGVSGSTQLAPLLDGYVDFLERIQNRDGSFDQIYPYEKAPGVVHDILSSLVWLWRSGLLSEATRGRLEAVMRRAVDYTLRSDEKHGEIANHFAQYAFELVNYGTAFGDERAIAYGRTYLERTLALFDEGEGWFREYDGADAGYQTRCVMFLSRLAELTGDEALWRVLRTAGGFLDRMTMPDGSLHPMLGVRSTALTYVSGFERLAARFPELAPLADRIHASWATGRAITPERLDFENALRIADDAFDAAELRETRLAGQAGGAESGPAAFDMPRAGLHRRSLPGSTPRTLDVATRLGGIVVVHETPADGDVRLAYEDSGYLVELADGSRWTMRHPDSTDEPGVAADRFEVSAHFTRALHEDMTPPQLILLRVLNLTVLRSQFIGDIFKKLVVRRLISGRARLGIVCHRAVSVADGMVTIVDRLEVPRELAGKLAGARVLRCRRTIANHMASSRYFQLQELEGDQPWTEEMPQAFLAGKAVTRRV